MSESQGKAPRDVVTPSERAVRAAQAWFKKMGWPVPYAGLYPESATPVDTPSEGDVKE